MDLSRAIGTSYNDKNRLNIDSRDKDYIKIWNEYKKRYIKSKYPLYLMGFVSQSWIMIHQEPP